MSVDTGPNELARGLTQVVSRIDARLHAVDQVIRVAAGATLETWAFDGVGDDRRIPLILRRAAGVRAQGTVSLPTEADVLRTVVAHGVPVPAVWGVLTAEDGLGQGFLMQRIEGWTIPQKILRAPELARVRPTLVTQLGRILAAIHAVPAALLSGLPRMDASARLREVEQQHRAQQPARPVFELALRWLQDHLPAPCEPALVHGDYRNGNLIIGEEGVRAVLDWEGVHLGDPAEDLAWMCLPPWRFGVLDKPAGGLGSREQLLEAYAEVSQRASDSARIRWWEVMGSLRWGVLCAEMTQWVRTGRDRTIERAMIARRASESEFDLLRLLAPR